ncbi:Chorion peroxidase [Eumeta japonica]|uniref:Chorion peroxidase n=1 Tax=Eumeta variegata TaxID=151549 RepID=A0A4C1U5T0_EUMVA|nr:Chorion peroxidase [Eumeta japonica]
MVLNQNIQPETIVDAMLTSEASWNTTSTFAAEVLIDLRSIERRRVNDAKVPTVKSGGVHETLSIPEVMFEPARLRLRPFLDRLLRGLCLQPMQSVDPFVTESLTRYMFHGGNPYGLDLAAVNVQRGRDHGLRPYNDYRRLCGLQPYVDLDQFAHNAAERLSSVYSSPEDIDLWIGGLLEEPVDDGVVGATFANIIADQFSRLKRGDRYFYEYGPDVNPGAFTPGQLAEIKKVTMARLVCDNGDGLELTAMGPAAFLRADLPGQWPSVDDGSIATSEYRHERARPVRQRAHPVDGPQPIPGSVGGAGDSPSALALYLGVYYLISVIVLA